MNFKIKAIAVVAALVAGTSAHADFITASNGNSSFALVAFNTVTNSYYARDLGYTLNSFLPNSVTTTAADGGGSPITGDKTPETGTTITWGDTDGNFASWYAAQTTGSIKWTVAAGDAQGTAGTSNVQRDLVAFSTVPSLVNNQGVRNATQGVSNLVSFLNDGTNFYSKTGPTVPIVFLNNNGLGAASLSDIGSSVGLYYLKATVGTLSNSAVVTPLAFANSQNTATLSLNSTGVLTYDLQPVSAVPVPAAAWLMGSGLMAIGGMIRRRKAAAQA